MAATSVKGLTRSVGGCIEGLNRWRKGDTGNHRCCKVACQRRFGDKASRSAAYESCTGISRQRVDLGSKELLGEGFLALNARQRDRQWKPVMATRGERELRSLLDVPAINARLTEMQHEIAMQ
jgi:hypothetical protein